MKKIKLTVLFVCLVTGLFAQTVIMDATLKDTKSSPGFDTRFGRTVEQDMGFAVHSLNYGKLRLYKWNQENSNYDFLKDLGLPRSTEYGGVWNYFNENVQLDFKDGCLLVGDRGRYGRKGIAYVCTNYYSPNPSWVSLIPSDSYVGDDFGRKVQIDFPYAFVSNGSVHEGTVFVFKYTFGNWVEVQKIKRDNCCGFGSTFACDDGNLFIFGNDDYMIFSVWVYKNVNGLFCEDQCLTSPMSGFPLFGQFDISVCGNFAMISNGNGYFEYKNNNDIWEYNQEVPYPCEGYTGFSDLTENVFIFRRGATKIHFYYRFLDSWIYAGKIDCYGTGDPGSEVVACGSCCSLSSDGKRLFLPVFVGVDGSVDNAETLDVEYENADRYVRHYNINYYMQIGIDNSNKKVSVVSTNDNCQANIISETLPNSIEVYTLMGRRVMNVQNVNEREIEMSSLPAGNYIVVAKYNDDIVSEKFAKRY